MNLDCIIPLGPNESQYEIDRYKVGDYWVVVELGVCHYMVRIWYDNPGITTVGLFEDGRNKAGSYVFEIFINSAFEVPLALLACFIMLCDRGALPAVGRVRHGGLYVFLEGLSRDVYREYAYLVMPIMEMHHNNRDKKKPLITLTATSGEIALKQFLLQ